MRMNTIKSRRIAGGWLAGTMSAASLCTVAAVAADAVADTGSVTLDEVVVTATKRSENLQNVPLSVSVVSQAALQSENLSNTSDLKRLVPGLQFNPASTAGNNTFSMRGVYTSANGYGLEQSVGVAVDGIPIARPVGAVADLVDIQRVEALKGPQGMLFGKNASAGLLNIVTNLPELGKTETILRASFGSLNDRQYTGTVNLPVTDDSAIRLSAWKFSHDGPIHEVNTGQDMGDQNSGGARFKLRWKPTDALDVNFTGEWTSHDENGPAYTLRAFAPDKFTAANAGAAIEAWELAHGTVPSAENHTARGLDLPYYDKGNTGAYTGQADYSIGEGTITTLVSYRDIKNDNPFDPYPTDNPYNQQTKNQDTVHYDQLTEEIHYTSPAAERFRYVVGVFNFRLKLHEDFGIGFNLPVPVNDDFEASLKNENYAGFGEATFDITSKLHFIAGIRQSTDRISESMNRSFLNPVPPASFLTAPGASFGPYATSVGTSYNDTSWRTGLQYQFTPDAMLYATASRGYKGPGVAFGVSTTAASLALANNGIVKPEIVHAYEVGFKSQWFDRRVTANLAVFNEIFDNFQTSVRVPGPGLVFVTQNARQLTTSGVDLDASWLVTPEFSVTGSVNYDNARYTDFKNSSCFSGETVAQGCIGGVQNLDGKALLNAPKTTSNLTARYEHPLSSTWRGFIQANDAYRSKVQFNQDDPAAAQGGYNLVNLTLGVDSDDGRWNVSVYANNVLDKHYVDYIISNASGAFYTNRISYGDLQTFGIAVGAKF